MTQLDWHTQLLENVWTLEPYLSQEALRGFPDGNDPSDGRLSMIAGDGLQSTLSNKDRSSYSSRVQKVLTVTKPQLLKTIIYFRCSTVAPEDSRSVDLPSLDFHFKLLLCWQLNNIPDKKSNKNRKVILIRYLADDIMQDNCDPLWKNKWRIIETRSSS